MTLLVLRIVLLFRFDVVLVEGCGGLDNACAAETPPRNEIDGC